MDDRARKDESRGARLALRLFFAEFSSNFLLCVFLEDLHMLLDCIPISLARQYWLAQQVPTV